MSQLPTAVASDATATNDRRSTAAGILLLSASCLPLLGVALLTPNLAAMSAVFAGTPGLPLLISLVVTAPGAAIAVLAPFAGFLSDRVGRKRILVIAAVLYSIAGVLPIFLNSLVDIVISRVALGVCEAVVITVCTALIADYYEGKRRAKYLGLQTVFTSTSAIVFVAIGGAAASVDWRTPFLIYSAGILLALPLALVLWEPLTRSPRAGRATAAHDTAAPVVVETRPRMPWRYLALPIVFSLYSGLANSVVTINASFMLPARGFSDDPAAIGVITAVLSVGTAVSALSFRWLARFGPARLLPVAYTVQGIGLLIVAFAPDAQAVIVGGLLAHLGFGIQLPTLITWALSGLTDKRTQGRASGLWTGSFWIGQLLFSFVFTGLSGVFGLFGAVSVFAIAALVFAIGAAVLIPRRVSLVGSPATIAEEAITDAMGGVARAEVVAAEDARAGLIAAEEARARAVVGADRAALRSLFDDELVITHSTGLRETGAAFIDSVTSGALRYSRYEPRVAEVVLRGDQAVVSGELHASIVLPDGREAPVHALSTAVWTLTPTGWRLLAVHTTPISVATPGAAGATP